MWLILTALAFAGSDQMLVDELREADCSEVTSWDVVRHWGEGLVVHENAESARIAEYYEARNAMFGSLSIAVGKIEYGLGELYEAKKPPKKGFQQRVVDTDGVNAAIAELRHVLANLAAQNGVHFKAITTQEAQRIYESHLADAQADPDREQELLTTYCNQLQGHLERGDKAIAMLDVIIANQPPVTF